MALFQRRVVFPLISFFLDRGHAQAKFHVFITGRALNSTSFMVVFVVFSLHVTCTYFLVLPLLYVGTKYKEEPTRPNTMEVTNTRVMKGNKWNSLLV